MLNLVTVSFNYTYLQELYNSIPRNSDIEWWVVTNSERLGVPRFLQHINHLKFPLNENIENGPARINALFELIKVKDPNGHFQIIDEDTLYHPNSYNIYKEYNYFEGMIIGQQDYYNNTMRLIAHKPESGYIDTGMCICHNSALNHIKWPNYGLSLSPDAVFFESIYKIFGKERTKILDKVPISYYNYQKLDSE